LKTTAALGLGLVQRSIRILQQLIRIHLTGLKSADPDTDGDKNIFAVDCNGNRQSLDEGCGNLLRGLGIAKVGEQDDKFVPSHSGHGIALAYGVGETICGYLQNPIASGVAIRVVNLLESVDVQHEERHAQLMAIGHFHRDVEPVGK